MLRLIFFALLVFICYKFLRVLIGDRTSFKKASGREVTSEELVLDPVCDTYIPKGSAIRKTVSSGDVFFCSDACLKRYLGDSPSEKGP